MNKTGAVLLYDGHCVLCNYAVKKVLKWDKQNQYKFASLHSEKAKQLMRPFKLPEDLDSIVLIQNNQAFVESEAFLKILKVLKPYHLLRILAFLPKSFADRCYRFIASRRYRWFGKYDVCPVFPEKHRSKFL